MWCGDLPDWFWPDVPIGIGLGSRIGATRSSGIKRRFPEAPTQVIADPSSHGLGAGIVGKKPKQRVGRVFGGPPIKRSDGLPITR